MRISPNPPRLPRAFLRPHSHLIRLLYPPAIVFSFLIVPALAFAPAPFIVVSVAAASLMPALPGPSAAGSSDAKSEEDETDASDRITEKALQDRFVGKPLFLRGGWLGESLSFSENGDPLNHPSVGSWTLCGIQIDKIHVTRHHVEFEGSRYALHFLGALPNEDSTKAVDRIRITPKKKTLKITISREVVARQKKEKEKKKGGHAPAAQPAAPGSATVASSESDAVPSTPAPAAQATPAPAAQTAAAQPPASGTQPPQPTETPAPAGATPAQPAVQVSVNSTQTPAHAARILNEAFNKVFAVSLDEPMRAKMPEFWQLYYQAQANGSDFHPTDPNVLRAAAVDRPAKLLSSIAPESNDFAQASGIAGPALYRVVVGADGLPQQIAVERPIGFGLDENAVAALRKASFQPAIKGGAAVAQTVDLTVVFRIYSKRTAQPSSDAASADATEPAAKPAPAKPLPGPYSTKPAAAPNP